MQYDFKSPWPVLRIIMVSAQIMFPLYWWCKIYLELIQPGSHMFSNTLCPLTSLFVPSSVNYVYICYLKISRFLLYFITSKDIVLKIKITIDILYRCILYQLLFKSFCVSGYLRRHCFWHEILRNLFKEESHFKVTFPVGLGIRW